MGALSWIMLAEHPFVTSLLRNLAKAVFYSLNVYLLGEALVK